MWTAERKAIFAVGAFSLGAAVLATFLGVRSNKRTRARRSLADSTPKIWLTTSGRPSRPTFHVHTPDSETIVDRQDLDELFREQLPAGFKAGIHLELWRAAAIEQGIPALDQIKKNTLYIVRPHDLAPYPIYGNELHPDHLTSIQDAWRDGIRLDPVEIDVTADGRLYVEDGNHRLAIAARTNKPIAVRFRTVGPRFEPQHHARPINDRLR